MEQTIPINPPAITFRVYVICDAEYRPAGFRLTSSDAIESIEAWLKEDMRANANGYEPGDAERLVRTIEHHATGFLIKFTVDGSPVAKYEVMTFTSDQPLDL
jgi:hypothetical protein